MTVRDPVCGNQVDLSETEGRSEYDGHRYFFCSSECKETFDANPQGAIISAAQHH